MSITPLSGTPYVYNSSQAENNDSPILVPSHEAVNDPSETYLTLDVLQDATSTVEEKK